MESFGTIIQQFGFPISIAVALIYWWRKDYADLVKRVRAMEDDRRKDQKEYANSYAVLAERVTEALEEHNRISRVILRKLGGSYDEPPSTHHHHQAIKTPLPFPVEGGQTFERGAR